MRQVSEEMHNIREKNSVNLEEKVKYELSYIGMEKSEIKISIEKVKTLIQEVLMKLFF